MTTDPFVLAMSHLSLKLRSDGEGGITHELTKTLLTYIVHVVKFSQDGNSAQPLALRLVVKLVGHALWYRLIPETISETHKTTMIVQQFTTLIETILGPFALYPVFDIPVSMFGYMIQSPPWRLFIVNLYPVLTASEASIDVAHASLMVHGLYSAFSLVDKTAKTDSLRRFGFILGKSPLYVALLSLAQIFRTNIALHGPSNVLASVVLGLKRKMLLSFKPTPSDVESLNLKLDAFIIPLITNDLSDKL